MKNNKIFLSIGLLLCLITNSVSAQQSWNSWVADVKKEALAQGISKSTFNAAFADIHQPSRQVKGLSRSQPEHRLTYQK